MKKSFFSGIFLILALLCCSLFYGCGEKYAGLNMKVKLSYDDANVIDLLDNGGVRVKVGNTIFDDNYDGSYTFYLDSDNSTATANLEVSFAGAPGDFNYGAGVNFSVDIARESGVARQTSNGVVKNINVYAVGSTTVSVLSNEGGKKASIDINVVQVARSISFLRDDYALTKAINSTLNLNRRDVIKFSPSDSSDLEVKYELGYFDNNNFKAYTLNELRDHGIDYNKSKNQLMVVGEVDLQNIILKAIYNNPLKAEELEAITTLYIVDEISDFEIYLGSNRSHAVEDNKIDEEYVAELVDNIADLKYFDVVLKVNSNKENVIFGAVKTEGMPVDLLFGNDYEYENTSGDSVDLYKNASYTYCHYRVLCNKKTVGNSKFEKGLYNLIFTCDYDDYTVAGYPLENAVTIKSDNFVKNYSINDLQLKSVSIASEGITLPETAEVEGNIVYNYYNANVYINNASSVVGTQIKIESSTTTVSKENSKYTLSLYYYNDSEFVDLTTDFDDYFEIRRATKQGGQTYLVTNLSSQVFDSGTIFYLKANQEHVSINQKYYIVVQSVLPNEEMFNRGLTALEYNDLQAKASIKLSIVQGIESVENFDFYVKKYEVDENTGHYIKYEIDESTGDCILDETTGEYVKLLYDKDSNQYYKLLDKTLEDTDINRVYTEKGAFAVDTTKKTGVTFDSRKVANETIYIDFTSNFNANVMFNYLPDGADISNVVIKSSNIDIFEIADYIDLVTGEVVDSKNAFGIKANALGQGYVIITATNIDFEYKIPVSVYIPIVNISVNLLSLSGVGDFEEQQIANLKTLKKAVVEVGKLFNLNLSILPLNVEKYSLRIDIYTGENIIIPDGETEPSNKLGWYEIDHDGVEKSADYRISDYYFEFNCRNLSFKFLNEESSERKYYVVIRLTNLDESFLEKSFVLSSYIPVGNISVVTTNSNLYDPKTISYFLKDKSKNDPTIFGVNVNVEGIKIDPQSTSKTQPTFNFLNNGYIDVICNDIYETYYMQNGVISSNVENSIIKPISLTKDGRNYFWFTLNESFDYSRLYSKIDLYFYVKEFNYFSRPHHVSLMVQSAEGVSNLISSDDESIYFKHGISSDKEITISVQSKKSYDKTLLVKTLDIITVDENDLYIDTTDLNGNMCDVSIDLTSLEMYTLTLSPKRAGNAIVIIMPQDKIIFESQYNDWTNKNYLSVDVSADNFIADYYYKKLGDNYVLSSEFEEDATYYVATVNTNKYLSAWKDNYLVYYISIADGISVAYQIFTVQDLIDISHDSNSVTKKYVLVDDISLSLLSSGEPITNWNPIGNYYVVPVTTSYEKDTYYYFDGENYAIDSKDFMVGKTYYTKNASGEYVVAYPYEKNTYYYFSEYENKYKLDDGEIFDGSKVYYSYGFNGEFNFTYSYKNIKTGRIVDKNYRLYDIAFSGEVSGSLYGLFSIVGKSGKIQNSNISYNFFQPKSDGNFSFGGVSAKNYGLIEKSKINFSNINFDIANPASIGGIVGINYGVVNNRDLLSSGMTGSWTIKIKIAKDTSNRFIELGGIIGINYGELVGCYSEDGEPTPVFKDVGFDSSLSIDVGGEKEDNVTISIGGAVGTNVGGISNVAIQGQVIANSEQFDDIGGLVGLAKYSEDFNSIDGRKNYSVQNSYSIAKVSGRNDIGGAIGYLCGEESKVVRIFNVSAENYASISNNSRTFIEGEDNVGGLVGRAEYAYINYCYAVSYFDLLSISAGYEDDAKTKKIKDNKKNYDVYADKNSAGFICLTKNCIIENSASMLNIYSANDPTEEEDGEVLEKGKVAIFAIIADDDENSSLKSVFARGNINCAYYSSDTSELDNKNKIKGLCNDSTKIDTENGFSYCLYFTVDDTSNIFCGIQDSVNQTDTVENGISSILTAYADANLTIKSIFDTNDLINDGLPYFAFDVEIDGETQKIALFATTPLVVSAVVNYSSVLEKYIKASDNSLILFYNKTYLNSYSKYSTEIANLNIVKLTDFATLSVFAKTHKSYRLEINPLDRSVIDVLDDGSLKILKKGNCEIVISSKLNSKFECRIFVVVEYGITDIKVYTDSTLSSTLDIFNEFNELEMIKSKQSYVLFTEKEYTRQLFDSTEDTVKLQPLDNYGIRFYVTTGDFTDFVDGVEGISTLNDYVKINNLSWSFDTQNACFYIDSPIKINPEINPIFAVNKALKIRYVPYIKAEFKSTVNTILLSSLESYFELKIIKGASQLVLNDNLDNLIKINQLETQTFSITMYTDYEDDELVEMFKDISFSTYNDNNIWEIINNTSNFGDINNLVSIVRGDVTKKYNGSVLESITYVYTITYKDKINALDKDIICRLYFNATTDTNINMTLGFVIKSMQEIQSVYGNVYSSVSDFPRKESVKDIIYNGEVGVLAVDVYPYIGNFSKIRVSYNTTSSYPLLITQLRHSLSSPEGGKYLTDYPDSGSIISEDDYLWIEKSSGQDVYKFNDYGAYSFSKMYFLSLLVGSDVPDYSIYNINVDFLTRNDLVVYRFVYTITNVAKPSVRFSFDKTLEGIDNKYYLPVNTHNKINTKLTNFDGDITWSVSCKDVGYSLKEELVEVLMPYQAEDGNYYVDIMKYNNQSAIDNVFTTQLIGKTLIYTARIDDEEKISLPCSVEVLVTLFTVTGLNVKNVTNGYMSLPVSTTSPLYVGVDCYYDTALVNSADNWYNTYISNGATTEDSQYLKDYLRDSGYIVEEYFDGYIIQLEQAISKASYDNRSLTQSGVWIYKTNSVTYLVGNNSYNDSTFSVEMYNDYFAVYGNKVDVNSNMIARLALSYSYCEEVDTDEIITGIPNVKNYKVGLSNIKSGEDGEDDASKNLSYTPVFNFENEFILNFVYQSDLINAIPVSSAEDFIKMEEGENYRLCNDIVLSDYEPISTAIKSFDGNNFVIYITSFAYPSDYNKACSLGLFSEVSSSTMLYNVKVYYTNRVFSQQVSDGELQTAYTPNQSGVMSVSLLDSPKVTFGGLTAVNNGIITNCSVSGIVSIALNNDYNYGAIGQGLNGGLVATNSSTGYITYSKVKDFALVCYGETGGLVASNSGKIVSSYVDSSVITNSSKMPTGGFVSTNTSTGSIFECFSQGYRESDDTDIVNTGSGLKSQGVIGGFVYQNAGTISDSYANISLDSQDDIAGFVYSDTSTSIISRCYSISYNADYHNKTIAFPFKGTQDYSEITVNGTLNNCYYLSGTDSWKDMEKIKWSSTLATKQANGLSLDEFATHTCFVNYDLSLISKTGKYADDTEYSYVDGYTWVIIEGKPVLVSTLIDTISQRNYSGKTKNYGEVFSYFSKPSNVFSKSFTIGGRVRTNYYYNGEKNDKYNVETVVFDESDLLYYTIFENETLRYVIYTNQDTNLEKRDQITLTVKEVDGSKVVYAEYGSDYPEVLDVNITSVSADKNLRAHDTIKIEFVKDAGENDTVELQSIEYCVLESASYFYEPNANKISHVVGSRTNPQIIYDYESFVYYLSQDTSAKYYRIVSDIDFDRKFTTTSYNVFKGSLQGNYMKLLKLDVSYLNNNYNVSSDSIISRTNAKNSFGLFAEIQAIGLDAGTSYGVGIDTSTFGSTIISNLTIYVVEVLSNSHQYVGALAGKISGNLSKKVVLNNIKLAPYENRAYVLGQNAVGGLAGYVGSSVIIKDIETSLCVNATKEMSKGSVNSFLYTTEENVKNVSYAGGVIGIFDACAVVDPSTKKNYNATNIKVDGEISVIGGIVGSAFGFIGKDTIVNYVNVTVKNSDKNFLKAITYAGGLVGENRGEIISSSVTYGTMESYSSVQVGSSQLTTSNFFYNNKNSDGAIAIGGLAGFNNGGKISNSITTVNVRDMYTKVSGGAVGRSCGGWLENVIATGAVTAREVVGGLIGTVNDNTILINADYDESAISSEDVVTIKNCVSANNWLIKDCTYYLHLKNIDCPVGGFIGLIAKDALFVGDIIDFSRTNSYFVNTVYIASNSTNPKDYLKPAYSSEALDKVPVKKLEQSAIDILKDSDGNQIVYPYSTREMYFEDRLVGVYYTVASQINPYFNTQTENPYQQNIFDLRQNNKVENLYSAEEGNKSSIFKQIDLTDEEVWTTSGSDEEEIGGREQVTNSLSTYNGLRWLNRHFGTIYKIQDGKYVKVTSSNYDNVVINSNDDYLLNYYYIGAEDGEIYPQLKVFEVAKTFEGVSSSLIYKNLVYSIEDSKINLSLDLIVNGVLYSDLTFKQVDVTDNTSYTADIDYTLPNGVNAKKILLTIKDIEYGSSSEIKSFLIESCIINYLYDTATKYISIEEGGTNAEKRYDLAVSSKAVIFNSFIDNGYWNAKENFLLNNDYANTDKYLENLEFASTYLWQDFVPEDLTLEVDADGTTFYINSAEDLALLSKQVNSGSSYEGKTIILNRSIDLSGKYWIPIGTEENPFKGTFFGGNYSIKYATVNEKSNNGSEVSVAGLFGVIQNANIGYLILVGGDIKGDVAGGLVGCTKGNCTIKNITSRNNVTGNITAGGIIGMAMRETTSPQNMTIAGYIYNYGNVNHQNPSFSKEEYGEKYGVAIGGIVGFVHNIDIVFSSTNIKNYGNISILNNRTSYLLNKYVSINAGGLFGEIEGGRYILGKNVFANYGKISCNTNCRDLIVGGIAGFVGRGIHIYIDKILIGGVLTAYESTANYNNYGDISLIYTNAKVSSNGNPTGVALGGVFGRVKYASDVYHLIAGVDGSTFRIEQSISNLGNEGNINIRVSTSTYAVVAVGGVIGNLDGSVTESYNFADISVSTVTNRTTVACGGIVGLVELGDATDIKEYQIANCYNAGSIHGDQNAQGYYGGILGTIYGNKIVNSTEVKLIFDPSEDVSLFSHSDRNSKLNIYRCLNIGSVNVTSVLNTQTAVGAITSRLFYNTDTESLQKYIYVILEENYYLRGNTYSGNTSYTAGCVYNQTLKLYEMIEDEVGMAESKLSSSLRKCESPDDPLYYWTHDKEDGFGNVIEVADKWTQKYDTWFPSLNGNESSSLWSERQEILSQENGNYIVKTAEELSYITNKINSGDFSGRSITIDLAGSIDLSNRYWTPIGTENHPFVGTFNGNGYVIKNMTIDGNVVSQEYAGLFGYVVDSTILNIGLENLVIRNVDYAGGICYSMSNSRLEKCYTDFSNSNDSIIMAKKSVGGLVCVAVDCAKLHSNKYTGGIYYSYNNVPVYLNSASVNLDVNRVGGLVAEMKNSSIANSYNNSKGHVNIDVPYDEMYNSFMISSKIDKDCTIFNVFNLATITNSDRDRNYLTKIYKVDHTEATTEADAIYRLIPSENTPEFNKLSKDGESDLETIWTTEYSLNETDYSKYPSLRGLGKEWKNTDTEPLTSYVYDSDRNYLEESIYNYVEKKSLIKIENPNWSYYDNAISHKCYLISTPEELAWVAKNINNGSLQTTNCQFILVSDIDLSKMYWTPIGTTSVYPFQGIFNFNGHVISNLTIDTSTSCYGGLFGYTYNAYICNGYINNAFVKVSSSDAKTSIYAGTVVGKGYNTTINNIAVTTNLCGISNAGVFVGGIVGSLTGSLDYVISNVNVGVSRIKTATEYTNRSLDMTNYYDYLFEDCVLEFSADGTVLNAKDINNNFEVKTNDIHICGLSSGGNAYVGGVVGYISGYSQDLPSKNFLLENAVNDKCNIFALSSSNSSSVYAGGVVGYALEEVFINSISSTGNIKSYTAQYEYVGGVAGRLYGCEIGNAYFDGYIDYCQDTSHIWSYIGGIVGMFEYGGKLGNCVEYGEIRINTNYNNIANIGYIAGCTYDHYFSNDFQCTFNSKGGLQSIGLVDWSDGTKAVLADLLDENSPNYNEEEYLRRVDYSCYNTSFDDFAESGTKWTKIGGVLSLIISHINLQGCQSSFGYNSSTLDHAQMLEHLNVELSYTGGITQNPQDEIVVALVDVDYNYTLVSIKNYELSIDPTDESLSVKDFNLKTLIEKKLDASKIDYDKLIACYVKLIWATT